MEQVLIILNALDIPSALFVAHELSNYKTLVFDPGIHDEVLESGLKNVEFIDFVDCPPFPELHNDSRELALIVERELFESIKQFLPGISNFSWLHLNFYYFFIASRWYNSLGVYLADNFAVKFGDAKLIVFINDNPALFFWPSFVPAVTMLEAFQAKHLDFQAFTYGVRADESDVIPLLIDLEPERGSYDVLVHLPTCLHDKDFLSTEITASAKSVINLRAKYWDVSVPSNKEICLVSASSVLPCLSEVKQAQLATMVERLAERIKPLLAAHIHTDSYCQRQTDQLVSLYRSQLITYMLLLDFFAGRVPSKMLLSDHDAGFHGPLLAYAEVENIPVLFVPHSKTTADIQFGSNNIICLTHPIQGEQINDARGQRVTHLKLSYPEHFEGCTRISRPLKRVGLLLNAISLNGVFVTSYAAYMAGIVRIADWSRACNIELTIRGRPGHTMNAMLAELTGIAVSTLQEGMNLSLGAFVADQDLCLMYDAPTTAEIDFLRNSVPILNPVPEPLAKYEAVIANTDVISRSSVEETLLTLDSFISDPVNFQTFRLSQFGNYVNAFQNVQTLRTLLQEEPGFISHPLSALTIIVPTYNRHSSLAKMLEYYSLLPVKLIVVDGSAVAFDISILAEHTCDLRYFHMPVSINERIAFACTMCDTEFAMFSCDDEYYLAGGLHTALKQLCENPSLSAVAGRCAAFTYNEKGIQIGTFYNFVKNYNELSADASARVRRISQCYPILSGFYYSVCRASAFKTAVNVAFKQQFACPFVQEVLFSLSLFIQGGMGSVLDLLWLRNLQAPPISDAQWNRKLDFATWYTDPQYAAEVIQMHVCVGALYSRFVEDHAVSTEMDAFFKGLIDWDRRLSAGDIESEKNYAFTLSTFLILCRQHGLVVDEESLLAVERIELTALIATSEMTQLMANATTW